MIRLYVSQPLKKSAQIPLDDKAAHYLVHVMRCQPQDQILCFNGEDGEWIGQLDIPSKKKTLLNLINQTRPQQNLDFCALCPALIKKDNMDLVFQKATELGVTDIYPLITDHTVHAHLNWAHAQAIIKEAAEQCERLSLPTLHEPCRVADLLQKLPGDCVCCCLEERDAGKPLPAPTTKIAFLIGPEGGWSNKEKQFFQAHNILSFHADIGILRAETASIAILAHWQFRKHKK